MDNHLSTAALAERWDVSTSSLANARCAGEGPPYMKLLGGGVRYRLKDVEAYESERLVTA